MIAPSPGFARPPEGVQENLGAARRFLVRPAALLLWVVLPVTACPLPAPAMKTETVQAAWKVEGAPIAVGRQFAIEVQLCPASAVLARVDASMPEHRHGMNYRPSVKSLGAGRWRVEGLMFHMPGRWELQLDVKADGRIERLLDNFTLQ
jgi:hypothetical protein